MLKLPSMGLVSLFLKTELTCIPSILDRFFGKYYNNALCNAATWIFLLWCLLHMAFDWFLNSLFKKMKYKLFIRERLTKSIWYLGFYSTALLYSGATLYRNSIEIFRLRFVQLPQESVMASQSIIGVIVLLTFFMHSAVWESIKYGHAHELASFSFLSLFLLFTHYLRIVEVSFSLIAVISLGQVLSNFTQCIHILGEDSVKIFVVRFLLTSTILMMIAGYTMVIPVIILPFIAKIVTSYPNGLVYLSFISLLGFLVSSAYKSVLHRFVNHWLNHSGSELIKVSVESPENIIECILYPERVDEAYTLKILRKEAEQRKSKKVPDNRNRFMQTLKCIVAIKRKLHQRRHSEETDEDTDTSKTSETEMLLKPESIVKVTEADDIVQSKVNNQIQPHSSNGPNIVEILDSDDAHSDTTETLNLPSAPIVTEVVCRSRDDKALKRRASPVITEIIDHDEEQSAEISEFPDVEAETSNVPLGKTDNVPCDKSRGSGSYSTRCAASDVIGSSSTKESSDLIQFANSPVSEKKVSKNVDTGRKTSDKHVTKN